MSLVSVVLLVDDFHKKKPTTMLAFFRNLHHKLLAHRARGGDLGRFGPAEFESLENFFAEKFEPVEVVRDSAAGFSRLAVIGDLHGDLALFWATLCSQNCIDRSGNWTGDSKLVVQVGDFLDRGGRYDDEGNLLSEPGENEREEIDIMQYAWFLDCQARQYGGEVVLLSGNHEYMNFAGNFSGTTQVTNRGWGGPVADRRRWFRPDGTRLANYFIKRHPVMLKVGRFVFVHGGLGKPCDRGSGSFDSYVLRVNADWVDYLAGRAKRLSKCVEHVLFSRQLSDEFQPDAEDCDRIFEKFLTQVGLPDDAVLFVGHTPQVQDYQPTAGVNSVCGNRVWRVDVGASEAFKRSDRAQGLLVFLNDPTVGLRFQVVGI